MSDPVQTNDIQIQQAVESALKKKRKKKRTIVLIVIAIIAAIIIAIAVSSGDSQEDTTPVLTVSADEIIADYKSNEVTANEKYKDKYITVNECTVKNISDGFFYVEAKDEDLWLEEMVVYYSDDQTEAVKELKENDIIAVSGKILGTSALTDVKMENAKIEK